jgi:hypothetical protein
MARSAGRLVSVPSRVDLRCAEDCTYRRWEVGAHVGSRRATSRRLYHPGIYGDKVRNGLYQFEESLTTGPCRDRGDATVPEVQT